jgi:hypothetical protein
VPKKRGPKTDVLEALLKRVDGLERRLKDEKKSHSPNDEGGSGPDRDLPNGDSKPKRPQLDTENVASEEAVYSPTPTRRLYLRLLVNLHLRYKAMYFWIHTSPDAMAKLIIYSTRLQHGKGYS